MDLVSAAASGREKTVSDCLARGMDPNAEDADGTSALTAAATWGFANIVSLLLDAGANVGHASPHTQWTALHAAASQGHGKVVMQLLNAGANPVAKDSSGRTPADFASTVDAIWPFFAAKGCDRATREELRAKGLLHDDFREGTPDGSPRASAVGSYMRPPVGSPRSPMRQNSRLGTAAGASLLAEQPTVDPLSVEPDVKPAPAARKPSFNAWRGL
eukprot:jgi/Mesvir1/21171/Mv13905-RA.1